MSPTAVPARKLVICIVGGTADAVVASLKAEHADRIVFVPSPQTRTEIEARILPLLQSEGYQLSPGQYVIRPVTDAQDFEGCVKAMRGLEPEVADWLGRGSEYSVGVDITCGTKCMSAALALVARRWRCKFIYVGGAERTKTGIGIVVSGKEQIVNTSNPWESLGYQAIEDAALLFGQGNYASAVGLLRAASRNIPDGGVKRELATVQQLAEAYDAWDSFDHNTAAKKLQQVEKNVNDLRHAFPGKADGLEKELLKHRDMLARIQPGQPANLQVGDLLGNAHRRAQQGRYDDAVARLYRAIEAAAQIHLRDHGFSHTGKVTLESLPETLRSRWQSRFENGFLKLGLQDDYELLRALDDPLGKRFFDLGLNHEGSPLSMRNQSILAHGFQPVGQTAFQALWKQALELLLVDDSQIPQFPVLGAVHD
jgi:CRISPR-associated protein (TIGR02710 family)